MKQIIRADSPSVSGAAIENWTLHAPALRGQTLTISSLEATMTDALARIEYIDGTSWTERFTPRKPASVIPAADTAMGVAGVYLSLGIEHILLGIDHLLFVLALLLITRGTWRLVKSITAFTVAHSLTLALATLGVCMCRRHPSRPRPTFHRLRRRRDRASGTRARGHCSAGTVGRGLLLRSFARLGFAGALSEVGLPAGHIPLALLFFNLGVEAGQLVFVAIVLSLVTMSHRVHTALPAWAPRVPAYAIGSVAMFWTIQRVARFESGGK